MRVAHCNVVLTLELHSVCCFPVRILVFRCPWVISYAPLLACRLPGKYADQNIDCSSCLTHVKCSPVFANSVNTYTCVYPGKAI